MQNITQKAVPKRTLGLVSATAMLVGTVVGASVFIVPGQLASSVGPAVWLSYLIGAAVIVFTAMVFANIGSVMPVSAAVYRVSVSAVNGTWGFLYIWVFALSSVFLMPIMALTTAQYLGVFHPSLNSLPVAVAVIVVTGLINIIGLRTSANIQNILVVIFVTVISIFIVGGVINANWDNFVPMLPNGLTPVVVGVIATYYAFAGFNNIIELSGEIKNPGRNIVRVVFLSLALIVVFYIGVAIASVALLSPAALGVDAPVSAAAAVVFPSWFSGFIALAAVAASWTTLNAVMAAMSRQVFALSKSRIFPALWARVNRGGTPFVAVIVIALIGVVTTLFSDNVMKFVNLSGTYLLATAMVAAVSSLMIPRRLPERYATAEFKLKGFWHYFWPIGILVTSTFFLVLAVMDDPVMSLASGILVPIGILLYQWRARAVRKTGLSVEESVAQAVEEETAEITVPGLVNLEQELKDGNAAETEATDVAGGSVR